MQMKQSLTTETFLTENIDNHSNKILFIPLSTTVSNLAHVAQGFITTIEDAMLSFANNCATAI